MDHYHRRHNPHTTRPHHLFTAASSVQHLAAMLLCTPGTAMRAQSPPAGYDIPHSCKPATRRLMALPIEVFTSVLLKAGRHLREVCALWKELHGPLTCGLCVDADNSTEDDIDRMLAQDPTRFHHISALVCRERVPLRTVPQAFPNLRSLSLGDSTIPKDDLAGLRALSALKLRSLSVVEQNGLHTEQLEALLVAMAVHHTLAALDIGQGYVTFTELSEPGLLSLQALGTGLQSLKLGISHLGAFSSFCDALASMSRLRKLSIRAGLFDATNEATWLESSTKLSALTALQDLKICFQSGGLLTRAALRSMPCGLSNLRRLRMYPPPGEDLEEVIADCRHVGTLRRSLTSLCIAAVSATALSGILGRLTALQDLDLSYARGLPGKPQFLQCLALLPPSLRNLTVPWSGSEEEPAVVRAAMAARHAPDCALRFKFVGDDEFNDGDMSSDGGWQD
jgi:hypothetical protein